MGVNLIWSCPSWLPQDLLSHLFGPPMGYPALSPPFPDGSDNICRAYTPHSFPCPVCWYSLGFCTSSIWLPDLHACHLVLCLYSLGSTGWMSRPWLMQALAIRCFKLSSWCFIYILFFCHLRLEPNSRSLWQSKLQQSFLLWGTICLTKTLVIELCNHLSANREAFRCEKKA